MIEASTIQGAWPLTGVTLGAGLPAYRTRAVVVVRADQGVFVAKLDPNADPVKLAQRLGLVERLRASGYPSAPAVVPTIADDNLIVVEGACLWLLEYIPQSLRPSPGPDAWADLGEAAALLNAFNDESVLFGIPVGAALAEMAAWVRGRWFEAPYLALLRGISHLASLPASAVIHGEINGANAARRADGTAVLLDWDQAGFGPTALEYGYPLITAFLSVGEFAFDERAAVSFYTAYVAAGGNVDPDLAFDAALFHALRYMRFAEVDERWRRACYAVEHRDLLRSAIP